MHWRRSTHDYLPSVKRILSLPALAGCLALAGCGHGGNPRSVGVTDIPLPDNTTVAAQVRSCDRGANAYCAIELVVVGSAYNDSAALQASETEKLKRLGWSEGNGPDGPERSADSPGHELRLSYATAYGDLLGIDSSWIQRAPPIGRALSKVMFDRAPALSLMLQRGSS
jgi:hypothetical protein